MRCKGLVQALAPPTVLAKPDVLSRADPRVTP